MLYTNSIADNRIFVKLYNKGNKIFSHSVIIYYRKNGLSYNRIGLTAGKKVGNAVKRNRARRIIRAAYTENEILIPIGYDFVFVARNSINGIKTKVISDVIKKRLLTELSKNRF